MRAFIPIVVLVRTIYESNIGASSRAMANMGAERLILVDPKTELTITAQKAAASGQAALQNRTVYAGWSDFYQTEAEGIRIAFTARDGKGRQVRDFQETLHWLAKEHPLFNSEDTSPVPVYLIFGPEDWGLSGEDLEKVHFACSIPTFGDNTSLNLAQAALLALYTLRTTWGGQRAQLEGQQPKRKEQDVAFPEKVLRAWIEEMGFDTTNRDMNAFTVLRRMLLQNVPSEKEMRILNTVLNQGLRKLREYNQLRKQMGLPAIEKKQGATEED